MQNSSQRSLAFYYLWQIGLLGGLLFLAYNILHRFFIPVAWACVIAYATWPLYRRCRKFIPNRPNLSALLMTFILVLALIIPLLWLTAELRDESANAAQAVSGYLKGNHQLPDSLAKLPWFGPRLQSWINKLAGDPVVLRTEALAWLERFRAELTGLLGKLGKNLVILTMMILTLFFFYRDGEGIAEQIRRACYPLLGARVEAYFHAAGETVQAVFYGLILAAVAQGMMAGIGYWGAGLSAPILLSMLTVIVAMIPFGAPLVWGSLGIWLLLNGQVWQGVSLLLWGMLVVSWIDNLVRPLVISGATRIPFLLVVFGVFGGLLAFGLVGLFIGPIVLAILLAVWREWLNVPFEGSEPGV